MPKPSPATDINSFIANMRDRRRDGLYDRVTLKAGQPTPREILCFQRCVGPGVDWTETNMLAAGKLPAPWEAIICRFLFLFQPGVAAGDVALMLQAYVWEFWILQKLRGRQPMLACSVGGDMSELIEGFGVTDCNGKVRPYARPFSFRLDDSALYLPPLTPFALKLIGRPVIPAQDLDFYPILDGTIDYPVQ